jgi:hypothetical protein
VRHPHSLAEGLKLATTFHGLQHRNFVRVFDITADGDTHGDARYFYSSSFELLRQIDRSGLALHGGVGGKNDFIDVP